MKDIGINSNDFDNRIQFINTAIVPINILYDYNFISKKYILKLDIIIYIIKT